MLGLALNNYGILIARTGNLDARPILEESLLLGRRTGEPQVTALAVNNLAEIAVSLRDLDQADTLSNEALRQAREVGFRSTIASALHTRMEILLLRGGLENAGAQLQEAIALTLVSHAPDGAASLLSIAGKIAVMRGQALRAATLWGAADEFRARVATVESPVTSALRSRSEGTARSTVADAARWEASRAAGSAMSLHDALVLAAGDDDNQEDVGRDLTVGSA